MKYDELKYKNCLFCRHFCFVPGTRDYSDLTPGDDVELYCSEGAWRLDVYDDGEGESVLISHMLTARSCDKYEERKELKVGAKVRIKRETVERFKIPEVSIGEVIQIDDTHYDGKFYRPFKVRFTDKRESWWASKELRVM